MWGKWNSSGEPAWASLINALNPVLICAKNCGLLDGNPGDECA